MDPPRLSEGWLYDPPSPTGRTARVPEPLTADFLWRLLHAQTDIPDRGRALFPPPLGNQNRLLTEFRSYVRQAETYFRAAELTASSSAALPLYYCALNLAKAELLIHSPQRIVGGARIGHGLSTQWGSSPKIRGDRLLVKDGVFSLLYRHRLGSRVPREQLPVMRVLQNVPEVGFELRESGQSSAAGDLFHVLMVDGRFLWSMFAIPMGTPMLEGSSTMAEFTSDFEEVGVPVNAERVFALSKRWGAGSIRYFQERTLSPTTRTSSGGVPDEFSQGAAAATWRRTRKILDETPESLGELVSCASLYKSRMFPMLLHITQTIPTRAANRHAAEAATEAIVAHSYKIRSIRDRFPIDTSGEVPDEPLFSEEETTSVRLLADQLELQGVKGPTGLVVESIEAARSLMNLQLGLSALNASCRIERREASVPHGEVTWARVKGRYYTEIRDEVFSAEWAELTGGEIAKDADRAVTRLRNSLTDYLLSDTSPTGQS